MKEVLKTLDRKKSNPEKQVYQLIQIQDKFIRLNCNIERLCNLFSTMVEDKYVSRNISSRNKYKKLESEFYTYIGISILCGVLIFILGGLIL